MRLKIIYLALALFSIQIPLAALPENSFYSLFSDETDAYVVERLPLEMEPLPSGLFQISSEELDIFERPEQLKNYLASLTGLSSFHSSKILGEEKGPLPSNAVQRSGADLVVKLGGKDLFESSQKPFLSELGQKNLLAVCEVVAPHLGKPILLDLWSQDVKRGQTQTREILSFLSKVLSIDPEEIESTLQIDPNEPEEIKIQVLGTEP